MRIEDWQERLAQGRVDLLELDRDLRDLEAEVQKEEAELQSRRGALDIRKRDRDALVGLRNFVAHGQHIAAPNGAKPERVTKPSAILDYLSNQTQAVRIADIRDALVSRGVIEDNPSAYHGLQVTLSQMFRKNLLERPRMGCYRLPSEATTTSLTQEAV